MYFDSLRITTKLLASSVGSGSRFMIVCQGIGGVCSVGFSVGFRWQPLLLPQDRCHSMLTCFHYQNSFHSMMNLVVISKIFQFSPMFGGRLPIVDHIIFKKKKGSKHPLVTFVFLRCLRTVHLLKHSKLFAVSDFQKRSFRREVGQRVRKTP